MWIFSKPGNHVQGESRKWLAVRRRRPSRYCKTISPDMSYDYKVFCVLCQRSEETKLTGTLSTKKQVTAHQNCLLFSSGICCQNSPQFDDLFGFAVEDVVEEVKRGSKLKCSKCKKRGATAGCEVGRCKKSYHYPCAVQDGAVIVEDPVMGTYKLFCLHHIPRENSTFADGCASSSSSSERPSEAGLSKKKACGDSTAEMLSGNSSDSSASGSFRRLSRKRRLSSTDKEDAESPTECASGKQGKQPESRDECVEEDRRERESQSQDVEASMESPPVSTASATTQTQPRPLITTTGALIVKAEDGGVSPDQRPEVYSPPVTPQNCPGSPSSQDLLTPGSVTGFPSCSSLDIPPALRETTPSPAEPPSEPEAGIDPSSFWRSCNAAGCTQAMFTAFTDEMNIISNRIQKWRASDEDYRLALAVMEASGKLAELVAKQQRELERKQAELTKAAAAMQEVVSALRR
ncbi:uncharacterized protein phf11 [Antennarius striatus]|uniref:uncharacterized protein phf11 n=1 Tax=Antennarius striatus TaxID=241820 RepID=UPI0035AFC72C